MQPSTAELEKYMNDAEQFEQFREQMQTLYQNLRTVRHNVNNHLAVIIATAELSQRNPAHYARLGQVCLEKAPQIAAAISGFTELFSGALSIHRDADSQPPASS